MRSNKSLISGVLSAILCFGGVSAGNNRSLTTGEKALVATVISVGAFKFSDKIRDFFRSPARRRTSENDKMDQMPKENVGPTKWFSCKYQEKPKFSSIKALVKENSGDKLRERMWDRLLRSKVDVYLLKKNGNVCKFAIYIRYNIKNGKSLTKNVKHETVNRILGIEGISMAGSPVSYSEKLGYYVEVKIDFGVNDDTKNLAEIIEPLVAIALRLNLKNNKKTIGEIARYLAYRGYGEDYANGVANAWFDGKCILDVSGNVVEILE